MMGAAVVLLTLLCGMVERRVKRRKVDRRVTVNLAALPGPLGFLGGSWVQVDGGLVTKSDVAS